MPLALMAIPGNRFRARAIAKFLTRATGINRSPSTRPARAASRAARAIPTCCHCGARAVIFRYSIRGRPWKMKPRTGWCSNPDIPVETGLAASPVAPEEDGASPVSTVKPVHLCDSHELESQSHLLRRWQHAAVPQSRAHTRASRRTRHRARWRAPARSGMPDQESVRWDDDWDDYEDRQRRPRFLVDVLFGVTLRDRT